MDGFETLGTAISLSKAGYGTINDILDMSTITIMAILDFEEKQQKLDKMKEAMYG